MAGKPATSSHADITRMAPKPAKAHLTLDGSLLQTRGPLSVSLPPVNNNFQINFYGLDASYIQTLWPEILFRYVEFMADIHPIFSNFNVRLCCVIRPMSLTTS